MKKQHKYDIFKVIEHLNTKNDEYFRTLSDEHLKPIQPYVVLRWLSGTTGARQVYFLNELVNPFVFSLYNHKLLVLCLMTICTSGKFRRYKWSKPKGKNITGKTQTVNVIRRYFGYSTKQASEVLPLLDDLAIIQYAQHLGVQPEDIKKIKTELKK